MTPAPSGSAIHKNREPVSERGNRMQYILGQLWGIVATVIVIAIPVFRKKWQMLLATLMGNLLMAVHFFLIGQIGSAIFLYFVAILQSIISMVHTVRKTKISVWEQILFCSLYVGLGIFGIVTAPGFVPEVNAANLLELLPIVGSAMLTFSIFARSEQMTRVFLLINTSVWAVYMAIIGSTGFFAEVFTSITTAYALWKYRKKSE